MKQIHITKHADTEKNMQGNKQYHYDIFKLLEKAVFQTSNKIIKNKLSCTDKKIMAISYELIKYKSQFLIISFCLGEF